MAGKDEARKKEILTEMKERHNLLKTNIAHFSLKSVLLMLAFLLGFYPEAVSQETSSTNHDLATGIIQKMRLSEVNKTKRLIDATVVYLEELDKLLNERALTLTRIEENYKDDSDEKDSLVVKAYDVARYRYSPLKKKICGID